MKMANNVYRYVTDRIISELQKGNIPWRKPWKGRKAINYVSRKEYQGINLLLLPYPGEYLTFKQIQEKKGKIKKGEKANMVVYFKMLTQEDENGKEETFPLLRYYNVFHISQTEGIESKLEEYKAGNENDIIVDAEKIVNEYIQRENIKLNIIAGSDKACYIPAKDEIVLPDISQFVGSTEYYSTAYHEMVHSTGHKSRLDRHAEQKTHSFGSQDYSKEELIAEIGSAMLCNSIGIEIPETFSNSVAYIQSWLKKLKDDASLIVSASGKAQKAVNYILKYTE